MSIKKNVYLGFLIALAFVFSYLEFLVPISVGIPGAKLGLANLVILISLYTMNYKDVFVLSIIRIVLVGFTFSNMASMLYSIAGAVLSFIVMVIAKKTNFLSITGVSVLGGIFHNVGQIIMAVWVLKTPNLIFYYLPLLIVIGCLSGTVIGVLGSIVTKRIQKVAKFY